MYSPKNTASYSEYSFPPIVLLNKSRLKCIQAENLSATAAVASWESSASITWNIVSAQEKTAPIASTIV